jgi:hypothetical protein
MLKIQTSTSVWPVLSFLTVRLAITGSSQQQPCCPL